MSGSREYKNYLVKVWGQRGMYTTELQVGFGWHGGDFVVDPIHNNKMQELTDNECAWVIIGVIQRHVPDNMHMLPVVDGWVYSVQGDRLRQAE